MKTFGFLKKEWDFFLLKFWEGLVLLSTIPEISVDVNTNITKEGKTYFQPRPNFIYKIGWFCAKLGRNRVMILVKDGTEIFSDFQGVL